MAAWPDGGALCLSFDNLGEVAEIELGAAPAGAPPQGHRTVTAVLPALLEALRAHDLPATFFVEGLNAELYPEALAAIAAGGHELGYHAWRHEQWDELAAAEQGRNLARGAAAFEALGLGFAGLRPPGGGLGAGGTAILREAGLRYCSPAGAGAGEEDGVALLPFQWRHVDATCLLPPLAPVREQMTGSPDPLDPSAFLAQLEAEIDRLTDEGGFATFVLHLSLLDWLGPDRLAALLGRVARAAREEGLWVACLAEVADRVLADPAPLRGATTLDPTSWTAPG